MLQAPPDEQTWGALVQALETFQGSQGLGDVISYCENFLARWPEEFSRPAPSTWASSLLAGEDTPHLRLVTHLAISGRKLGPEECRALVTCPHLAQLTSLSFAHGKITYNGMRLLVACDRWRSLRELRMVDCNLGKKSGNLLTQAPFLEYIERLDLSDNHCKDAVRSILSAHQMGKLTHLTLRNLAIMHGLEPIVERERFGTLRYLDLSGNIIRGNFTAKLSTTAHLANLEYLDLSGCRFWETCAIALAQSLYLTSLEHLDLTGTIVGVNGTYMLARSPNVSKLKFFGLAPRSHPEECYRYIVDSEYFPAHIRSQYAAKLER